MNITCPRCQSPMITRTGKFGPFYGCTKFRKGCRGTRPTAVVKSNIVRTAVVGSPEQVAIWDEIVNGSGHLIVNALAGSGKSFTCRESMHRVDPAKRVLYLAFNKAIVNEFKENAPANATISTLNSIGYRIVCNSFNKAILNVDKITDLISELYSPTSTTEVETLRTLTNAVEKLVALCQGYLIDPNDVEAILEVAARHEVELTSDVEEKALALVPQVLKLDRERCNVISYNDQLWLPIVLDLPAPKFDLIYVDEAQDLNPCQHQLVIKLLAPGGRVIVVGDTHQAIYGFRGSDVNSINNLAALLATTNTVTELPLTITRRCGKKIVEAAQRYVPTIQAMDSAVDGQIIYTDTDAATNLYQVGDMVVCRCNAPLTSVAYKLIKRGVKVVIRGREIGQGLVAIIRSLRAKGVNELLIKLDKWQEKETGKVVGTRRETAVTQQTQDRADCIRCLAEDCGNVSEVIARIESIFANFDGNGQPKGCVVMSSIHRAKGLEADKVFYLMPEIVIKCQQEWQHVQERNLAYVATTRAKLELYMVAEKRSK